MSDGLRLSAKTRAEIERLTTVYPVRRSALLPGLRLAQREIGWLPREAMDEVAEIVGVDPNACYALATFYDLFYREPVGKYVIGVCEGLACHLGGSGRVLGWLKERLGIGPGETTADGLFTVRTFECLAACDRAPCALVNDEYVGPLDEARLDELLRELRSHPNWSRVSGVGGRGSGASIPDPQYPTPDPRHSTTDTRHPAPGEGRS
ncbi:MAG: NADH-quinone oxidoreductase subunit NuoE [Chloroflexi bacterium]|nr:NADH-quinone oxidoreductase subunit NuoE [Chloroflexota bacterium]